MAGGCGCIMAPLMAFSVHDGCCAVNPANVCSAAYIRLKSALFTYFMHAAGVSTTNATIQFSEATVAPLLLLLSIVAALSVPIDALTTSPALAECMVMYPITFSTMLVAFSMHLAVVNGWWWYNCQKEERLFSSQWCTSPWGHMCARIGQSIGCCFDLAAYGVLRHPPVLLTDRSGY